MVNTGISLFFQNMYDSMVSVDEAIIEADANLAIADRMTSHNADFICHTVQQSSFGEGLFKSAFYKTSRTGDYFQRKQCLEIYGCFKEISNECICMLMTLTMQRNEQIDLYYLIEKMELVRTRSFVEDFIKTMTLSSLKKRRCSAKLLLRLVQVDLVSTIDVHDALIVGIEASRGQSAISSKERRRPERYLMKVFCFLCCEVIGIESSFNRGLDENTSYSAMLHIAESVPPLEPVPPIPEFPLPQANSILESINIIPGIPQFFHCSPSDTHVFLPIPFDSGTPFKSV